MRLRFHTQIEEPAHDVENLTSMVDVVFILLAFFVLTSQFGGSERDIVVAHQPSSVLGGSSDEDLPEQVTIHLAHDADTGATRLVVEQVELTPDAFEGITALLREVNVPALPVVIAPGPDVSIQAVARTMNAVLASPMRRVTLVTSSPRGEALP